MTAPAPDTASELLALERRVDELERERRELWLWVEHLERLAEAGLHARGFAHDVGNALTAIMASTELAALDDDPDENRKAVRVSLANARKAAERLHTFIAYSRRSDASPGPVGLDEALEDALRFLAYPIRKAEIRVERQLAVGPRVAMTHPRLLQVLTQALLTLIRGARHPGARIVVTARPDGQALVADLRRIEAEAGERETGRAERIGSTGFELHLAREILERAGGRILGEPADGLTGTVRIVLPTVPDGDETLDAPHARRSRAPHADESARWRAWSGGWTRG